MKTLNEYVSDDGARQVIISLEDEVFVIDYFENNEYVKTETGIDITYQEAVNLAEDFVLRQEHK
jgi:hypothetical protein